MKEHAAAGIRDYSIYREGDRFFYTFACDDVEAAFRYLAASEPFQRWNAITSNMKEGSFDLGQEKPIRFLEEVFRLD
jgi:L-rhamnose mutarotase